MNSSSYYTEWFNPFCAPMMPSSCVPCSEDWEDFSTHSIFTKNKNIALLVAVIFIVSVFAYNCYNQWPAVLQSVSNPSKLRKEVFSRTNIILNLNYLELHGQNRSVYFSSNFLLSCFNRISHSTKAAKYQFFYACACVGANNICLRDIFFLCKCLTAKRPLAWK